MDISIINRIGSVPYRTVPYATISYRNVPYRTIPYRSVPYYSLTETSHYRYSAVTLFNTNVGLMGYGRLILTICTTLKDYTLTLAYEPIMTHYVAAQRLHALYRQLLCVSLGNRAHSIIIAPRSGYGKAREDIPT